MSLLNVRDLSITFSGESGPVQPVTDVSFAIEAGKITAIVGESGCGKSITSLALMGLLPPDAQVRASEFTFDGRDLLALSSDEYRRLRGRDMSMIFQEPMTSLNPVFTVGSQIAESLILHEGLSRREAKKRSIELLERVGISRPEKVYASYAHALSGGMRQRVMIAIALACSPKLLIADEPTTALDVTIQAQILALLRELSDDVGAAILLITHDLGVVAEMADDVVVMYAGRVAEEADVHSLFDSPQHPYSRGLLASTPRMDSTSDMLTTIPGSVPSVHEFPTGCRFAPRCDSVMSKCHTAPPMVSTRAGCSVRCWLHVNEGTHDG